MTDKLKSEIKSKIAEMSPDCVRTWWADYTEEMAQHQLTELQMNILFCYSVLPIIEGELR